jgi:chorismate mutase / prephenate dehydratase
MDTKSKSETPEAFIQSMAALDREWIEIAMKRCELLRQWYASVGDRDFPSLRDMMQASDRSLVGIEGKADGSQSPDFARRMLTYLAGTTYAHAIHPVRIAYLGPEHSYSYLAATKFFGAAAGLQGVSSIPSVFEEIDRQQATYGVVPIENSTDGRIVDTLTMFIRMPLQICGEVMLPIHHNLLSRSPRSEIRAVYSKPQALSQCRNWLAQHLPNVRWVEVASTTAAAKIASEESGAAAVASIDAAIEYGLEITARNIEDNPNNATRFVIIGKETPKPTGHDKTSLMFQVPHKPGALADVMVLFKNSGINLTWIESFPVPGTANEYFFFVELEGHREQPHIEAAIRTLQADAIRLEWLGSYPRANLIDTKVSN